jgi:hypothetical protein
LPVEPPEGRTSECSYVRLTALSTRAALTAKRRGTA